MNGLAPRTRHRSRVGAVAACAAVVVLAAFVAGCDRGADNDSGNEQEQLSRRLDRPPVHFHAALRQMLAGASGDALWNDLGTAIDDDEMSEHVGHAIYGQRALGARVVRGEAPDGSPVLPAFQDGADEAAAQGERAMLMLAMMIVAGQRDDGSVPTGILLYEASRLDPAGLRPAVRPFVYAIRAWAYGAASMCSLAREEARRAATEPDDETIQAFLDRLAAQGNGDPARVVADLGRIRRLLADSANACCAIREGRHGEAAKKFAPRLDDAEALGIDAARLALLRIWVALGRGNDERARSLASSLDKSALDPVDRSRYVMLRTVLASSGPGSADDALERLVDRRWLSRLVLEGAVDALARDGVIDAMERRARPAAALRLAQGELAALAGARRVHPMFDQAPEKDVGWFSRIKRLWGGND